MEDDLIKLEIFSSIFLLVRSKASYIPKMKLLAYLVPEIAMKKTFRL